MDELEYLEENRSDEYDKAIVFIHGWKGNKDSFASLSSILKTEPPPAPKKPNRQIKNQLVIKIS